MFRRILITAAAGVIMAVGAMAEQIIVKVAPPHDVVEVRGRPPHAGWVYQKGYHRWDGHAHVWVPGVWVEPPHEHARWVDHHWEHRNGSYVFVEGRWR